MWRISALGWGALGLSGGGFSKVFLLLGLEAPDIGCWGGGSKIAGVYGGGAVVVDATDEGRGGGLFGEGPSEAGDGLITLFSRVLWCCCGGYL